MQHRLVITDEVEAAIKAELKKLPHASLVARESKGQTAFARHQAYSCRKEA
jgi:hypothetical protein